MSHLNERQIGWNAAGKTGIVAAGSVESVVAGITMLENGGNAVDAAIATILAQNVVEHGACSIGGEVPLMVFDAKSQSVKVLCGAGRAPMSPDAIAWYMEHGIPHRGDIKIAPVPSVLDLCTTALQRYGTMTFAEAVEPAMRLLQSGQEAWKPKLAVTFGKLIDEEKRASGSREERLQAVSDRFYGRNNACPDIADALEAYYIEKGGFLRRADLAAHVTTIEDPVCVDYRGYTVCKCGPWTQGPYLCQALRLLEGFDLQSMEHASADYIHLAAEAIKLAMADRDQYYGDPDFVDVPISALLSDAYTNIRRPLIDLQHASQEVRPGDPYSMRPLTEPGVSKPGPGGTTTCVVADRWGNFVAATPSANAEDSDGGSAGVTYSNRLCSLNTTPGHPNCIAPGKRPRITLTPTLVLKDGQPVMAVSVAGGDMQDQATLNLLLNVIEFGMMPEKAVTAPRFASRHYQDSFNPSTDREQAFVMKGGLLVDEGISPDVCSELSERGHHIEKSPIGAPVMLALDQQTGMVYAAGDPASGRHAAGVEED
ncbi:MAG: gamma-glutamyltransferase family protein [Armatimonadota bacterium]